MSEREGTGDDGEQDDRRDDKADGIQENRAEGCNDVLCDVRMGLQEKPRRDGWQHRDQDLPGKGELFPLPLGLLLSEPLPLWHFLRLVHCLCRCGDLDAVFFWLSCSSLSRDGGTLNSRL